MQPLSEKSRNYVLNLDIDQDARILQERLNICREALDYFRASSSILKAGVKQGLTLYEIACMCCRNDNLGEVPSKLEVLFSMASELAHSAVENGRWHHAAASRALAEQLSPKGGSLLTAGISKSMSVIHFPQYKEAVKLADTLKKDLPGMIQSSASDSSSDGEIDREDCEEWAASLIADVSMDKSMSMINTKERSPSIESDSSDNSNLSSSPKGFWHVRPGSSAFSDDSDDSSVEWSPDVSPKNILDLSASSFDLKHGTSRNLAAVGRRASVTFSGFPFEAEDKQKAYRSPSKVTFAESWEPELGLQPTCSVEFRRSKSEGADDPLPMVKRVSETNGIIRSQSYSALSERLVEEATKASAPTPLQFAEHHDQYRDYFLKFVDLVIVREITAAARQAKENL